MQTHKKHESSTTHWFGKRFRGESGALVGWKILRTVSLEWPDARFEMGFEGFRAVALMPVLAKCFAAVVVGV